MQSQILEVPGTMPGDDTTRWQAVQDRDERADGDFVYGVHSTHIFCRPSCPSRRPHRGGVSFFDSPGDAVQSGYRPCKRCQPDQFQTQQVARVERACRLIESNLDEPLSLSELAAQTGGSAFHLQRTFKHLTGVTPREYADALRLKQLKTTLQNRASVLAAQNDAGFKSSRGLYERAPSQLGMTPATYKRGGTGASMAFSITPCAMGYLLVSATKTGISSVTLGDTPETLEAELRKEFPDAELHRDDGELKSHVQSLLRYLEGQEPHLDLPLDVQSTAFQRRVWQELQAIGYGQTRTYSQVAQSLGQPSAVRAVARACATNPVGLVIPCHRVVREGGALAGYRWGLERKKALLAREKGA